MFFYYAKDVYFIQNGQQHPIIYKNASYNKCDIYSLGVTLYFLIFKNHPRNIIDESFYIIYVQIKILPYEKDLESLVNIILRMINMKPANRPSLDIIKETIK